MPQFFWGGASLRIYINVIKLLEMLISIILFENSRSINEEKCKKSSLTYPFLAILLIAELYLELGSTLNMLLIILCL